MKRIGVICLLVSLGCYTATARALDMSDPGPPPNRCDLGLADDPAGHSIRRKCFQTDMARPRLQQCKRGLFDLVACGLTAVGITLQSFVKCACM